MQHINHIYIRRRIQGTLIAMAFVSLCGCGGHAPSGQHGRVVRLIVGIDDSGSTRKYLSRYIDALTGVAGQMDQGEDELHVLRMDEYTSELFSQPVPEDLDAFRQSLHEQLEAYYPENPGTYPATFWPAVARDAAGASGPVAIALFSDGDEDRGTSEDRAAIRRAAEHLAANPNITYVAVAGSRPENRRMLYDLFAPLGAKFHIFGNDQVDLQPLLQSLDDAR